MKECNSKYVGNGGWSRITNNTILFPYNLHEFGLVPTGSSIKEDVDDKTFMQSDFRVQDFSNWPG